MLDRIREHIYASKDKNSTAGLIMMIVCAAIFIGAMLFMFVL